MTIFCIIAAVAILLALDIILDDNEGPHGYD